MRKKSTEVIIYKSADGLSEFSVQLENEDVWLTQKQLVGLYQATKSTVSEHIKNIYGDEELTPEATVRKIRTVQKEGTREVARHLDYYNLDMIIALGYRINSKVATHFRQWATKRLKEYIIKGFTMDDDRLKNLGSGNYWKELLNRIRDIRSSEKVMYRQVLCKVPTSGRDFTLRARIWECKESMPSTPGTTPSPPATTPQRCHCRASWQS